MCLFVRSARAPFHAARATHEAGDFSIERKNAASPKPLPVTSRGDAKATELVTKFKAISDPKEQTAFWRSLSPEQRTLILNAQ